MFTQVHIYTYTYHLAFMLLPALWRYNSGGVCVGYGLGLVVEIGMLGGWRCHVRWEGVAGSSPALGEILFYLGIARYLRFLPDLLP